MIMSTGTLFQLSSTSSSNQQQQESEVVVGDDDDDDNDIIGNHGDSSRRCYHPSSPITADSAAAASKATTASKTTAWTKPKQNNAKTHHHNPICCLRSSFILTLIVAATICGMVASTIINRLEQKVAISTFDRMAESAILRAKQLTSIKIEGANLLASIYSHTFPNIEQWPYVALPNFQETASRIGLMARPTTNSQGEDSRRLTFQHSFAFNPIVYPEQITDFEEFAKQFYEQEGYPPSAGVSPGLGFGIFSQGPQNKTIRYKTTEKHSNTTAYNNRYNLAAPIFQLNVKNSSVFMFDLHSTSNVGPWMESMLDCFQDPSTLMRKRTTVCNNEDNLYREKHCMYMTKLHSTSVRDEPTLNFGVPIWPVNNNDTVVGMITSTIHFTNALDGIVPPYFGDIEVVVSSDPPKQQGEGDDDAIHTDTDDSFSYIISGGVPRLVGNGDRHNKAMDEYAHSVTLNDIEFPAPASVRYKMTLYPTKQLFDESHTHVPLAVGLSFVGFAILLSFGFYLYDGLIQNESRRRKAVIALKRRFVRFVSHEIRTPLNTVYMGLELLQLDLQEEEQQLLQQNEYQQLPVTVPENEDNFVAVPHHPGTSSSSNSQDHQRQIVSNRLSIMQDIVDNCQNAVTVLNDILSYDKIEAGSLELEFRPVNMWDVVRTTVDEFQIQAKNRQISLVLHENETTMQDIEVANEAIIERPNDIENGDCCADIVTRIAEQTCVMGDSSRLASVIRNLISNALKFTSAHKSITVTMSFEAAAVEAVNKNNTKSSQGRQNLFWGKYMRPKFASRTNSENTASSSQDTIDVPGPRYGSIVINVVDEGVGMTESQLRLLFGEGVQFDANRLQHGGGSGLGLFIARNIVLLHGGRIYAHSDGPGLGASFVVEFPLYALPPKKDDSVIVEEAMQHVCTFTPAVLSSWKDDSLSPKISHCQIDDSARTHETHKVSIGDESDRSAMPVAHVDDIKKTRRRVLVVDDVISNSKMLVRLMERAGHTPETAMNGQEAVDMVKADIASGENDINHQRYDTVLMDYEMPIMNGPDATKIIRELGFRGAIFGVTGNALPEDLSIFLNHGADAVVTKPIRLSKIEECWKEFDGTLY